MATNKTSDIKWKNFPTVRQRINDLFNNELMSDVVFVFETNQQLMAHQLILCSGSQVFYQLFKELINCENKTNKQIISINDCDFDTFKAMVMYLYSDVIEVKDNNVLQLIKCAKKYEIIGLINTCSDFIVCKLNVKNCLKWWYLLRRNLRAVPESKLIDKCAQMVANNACNVLKSHDIIDLSIDELIELLSRNDLNITEYELFKTAIRWSYQECIRKSKSCDDNNLRSTLGSAFNLIRFPLMSCEELGRIVAQNSDIFTQKELATLISYVGSKLMITPKMPFSNRLRIPVCGDFLMSKPCQCRPQLTPTLTLSPIRQISPIAMSSVPNCLSYSMRAMSPCLRQQNGSNNGSNNCNKSQPNCSALKRTDNTKTAVITDPNTGEIVSLSDLASSAIKETEVNPQINTMIISNTIESNNDDKGLEMLRDVTQPLIPEDEEVFIDDNIGEKEDTVSDIKEKANDDLVNNETDEEVIDDFEDVNALDGNQTSSNIINDKIRIQYSRSFLISLKSSVMTHKIKRQLNGIYHRFSDILIDNRQTFDKIF